MRDGCVGVNNLTDADPALSPEASDIIDPYMIPGGQAAFDALVEINSLLYTLQAVAWLLTDFPEIVELDLNPVFTGPDGAFVAGGRAVLALKE